MSRRLKPERKPKLKNGVETLWRCRTGCVCSSPGREEVFINEVEVDDSGCRHGGDGHSGSNRCEDVRQETGDKRHDTIYMIQETGDKRMETCDRRQETVDKRQKTTDRWRKTEVKRQKTLDNWSWDRRRETGDTKIEIRDVRQETDRRRETGDKRQVQ